MIAITPLGAWWFGGVSGLPPDLVRLARAGLWIALFLPALSAFQSLYQGALVHAHLTRGVTESVLVYLGATMAALWIGAAWVPGPGLFVGLGAFVLATAAMVGWLRLRARGTLRLLEAAEARG